jgi:hypothetical protein
VQILGGKSGFKTMRDLILFAVGLGICIFHVVTTDPSDLSVPLLLFGGGLAGAPSVLKQDEKKEKTDGEA